MANYLHIEGMDLSGKTTLANNYAAVSPLEWQVNSNALGQGNPIWELADDLRKKDAYDGEIVGNLYVTALMADIRGFERPTANTIQDSTVALRSLAYHVVRGTPRLADVLQDLIKEHPRFDASFYLAASMEARRSRLDQRIRDNPEEVAPDDLMVVRNPDRFVAMEGVLREWSTKIFDSVVIDTTNMSPEMVLEEVNRHYQPGMEQ
jgi:thymidylate kinase